VQIADGLPLKPFTAGFRPVLQASQQTSAKNGDKHDKQTAHREQLRATRIGRQKWQSHPEVAFA
jgi:hypothetical protein